MSIDFTTSDAFANAITNVRRESVILKDLNVSIKLDVCTLQPSIIYRSGHMSDLCFFSDMNNIAPYKRDNLPIIKYDTKVPLKLLVFNWYNIKKLVNIAPNDISDMFENYIADEGIIRPAFPFDGTYANKLFASWVSNFDLDGWVASTDCNVIQLNVDIQNSDITNNQLAFKTNPYYPEIMLCPPLSDNIVHIESDTNITYK